MTTVKQTTKTLTTPELQDGMLVLTHGMRVRITGKTQCLPGIHEDADPSAYWFAGTVENMDEVKAAKSVPLSFLLVWEGGKVVREDSWTIQGNERATWSVIEE